MRLHSLEITAFGPFAETVSVDFDTLSDAGLFLLAGPTGSGKSSVLDAVCFALYGDVPGDRAVAKRLRCDRAAPGVAPRVVLEVSLGGRRFRFARSPLWQRPKRRGHGVTTEQASVVVAERVHATWVTRSTRLDDAGHLVGDLVGMTLDQFCQVAMLPQGRFQAFLRARSEDRHRLLQRLFRTGRFERVEGWLTEHRSALRRSGELHRARAGALVERISEAAGVPVPPDWASQGLDAAAAEGAVDAWAVELSTRAAHDSAASDAAAAAAAESADVATRALEAGRVLSERRDAHAEATRTLVRLEARQASHVDDVTRHDAALRARAVLPLLTLAHHTARASEDAAAADGAARAVAHDLGADPEALTATRDLARRQSAAASSLADAEAELAPSRHTLGEYARRRRDLLTERGGVQAARAGLPERVATAARAVAAARAATDRVDQVAARVEECRGRRDAARTATRLRTELDSARRLLVLAVDEVHAAKDAWHDVRELRLQGMAAEIAGALVVGGCCPVCGSADHPQRASMRAGAPDADAERVAQTRVDDAETERHLREEAVRSLRSRIEVADAIVGDHDAAAVDDALVRAETESSAVLAEAAGLTDRVALHQQLLEHEALLRAREADLHRELVGLEAADRLTRADLAALATRIQAALWATTDPDLTVRTTRLTALADACQHALDTGRALTHASDEHGRAVAALGAALDEHGFPTADQAAAGVLDDVAIEALATRISSHRLERARAAATLDEPEVAAAASSEPPDLGRLGAAAQETRALASRSAGSAAADRRRADRLALLLTELRPVLTAWTPVRESLEVATSLSAFVEGKSADNAWQMRLSAYVLAYRLTQVVAAANERLAAMSDHRYSLEHTARRGAGERRGGLSLLVRDDWSGESRDPATLSGGETFVVSLALALGLADVITQESAPGATGDTRLETLFVDEGFGSLDADTLDGVLDTLDELREGGRVVGVVSHVAEMRDRIPTRLEVVKHRDGSTLRGPRADPVRPPATTR